MVETADSIFLVGPMGSGKSAVGRALARAMDRDFVDSDAEIEARTGAGSVNVKTPEPVQGAAHR